MTYLHLLQRLHWKPAGNSDCLLDLDNSLVSTMVIMSMAMLRQMILLKSMMTKGVFLETVWVWTQAALYKFHRLYWVMQWTGSIFDNKETIYCVTNIYQVYCTKKPEEFQEKYFKLRKDGFLHQFISKTREQLLIKSFVNYTKNFMVQGFSLGQILYHPCMFSIYE